ncbi:hypothetical protein AVEN_5172-1 [Araneus ventricosus]|uniref:Uncharacterized protein n=1 Tax=Araneus ventricosus TaxID=182803 RepID=A0A4Y2HTB8_ARAVE|nr:hypothetical protein AVEN_5172-1 [Araneus ventricosus]
MIVALLLPPPPLTSSPPQLLAVSKHFGSQVFAVVFLNLIDIIFHLQSHDLGQRHNFVQCRLHRYCLRSDLRSGNGDVMWRSSSSGRYCLRPFKVTFDNALRA